jgi:hypothetical protein
MQSPVIHPSLNHTHSSHFTHQINTLHFTSLCWAQPEFHQPPAVDRAKGTSQSATNTTFREGMQHRKDLLCTTSGKTCQLESGRSLCVEESVLWRPWVHVSEWIKRRMETNAWKSPESPQSDTITTIRCTCIYSIAPNTCVSHFWRCCASRNRWRGRKEGEKWEIIEELKIPDWDNSFNSGNYRCLCYSNAIFRDVPCSIVVFVVCVWCDWKGREIEGLLRICVARLWTTTEWELHIDTFDGIIEECGRAHQMGRIWRPNVLVLNPSIKVTRNEELWKRHPIIANKNQNQQNNNAWDWVRVLFLLRLDSNDDFQWKKVDFSFLNFWN